MKKDKKEALKKALKAENRRIARDNKAFEKMSSAEKRVQIARDVLAQLATRRLIATSGTWLSGKDGDDLFSDKEIKKDPELQKLLLKRKTCEGCALGGMFMCAVQRADDLKVSKLACVDKADDGSLYVFDGQIDITDVFKYMKRFFSEKQLVLIEQTFEDCEGGTDADAETMDLAREFWENCSEYGGQFEDIPPPPETRMRLIMENIVANKGKFVATKKPVVVFRTPGYVG